MLIVADGGSTTTHWACINEYGEVKEIVTDGLNPYFVTEREVKDCLEKDVYPFIDNTKVEEVFFYGSGCVSMPKRSILYNGLEDFFTEAEITVETDLLGASIALLGKEKGLVGILGTGSSTCLFDGESIVCRQPSLGFLLGDDGSGAKIGLHLLSDYLQNDMPANLAEEFKILCPHGTPEILDRIYSGEKPNQFLGSLAAFALERKENEYMRHLLQRSFRLFFEKQVLKYADATDHTLSFVGSVAYYAQDILQDMAKEYNIRLGRVQQSPMEGLVDFYKTYYLQQNKNFNKL